ncbi:MAG: hypothetical protein VKI83_05810 [Synechococcaceae cyanobacterium]|nr:hypothetical protein [Synechococcaceae cyanobacterium]
MSRVLLPVLIGFAGLLAAAGPVGAHGIESSLESLSRLNQAGFGSGSAAKLRLASHYSSGLPASDAQVSLVPPGGGEGIDVGRTDTSGNLTFALPRGVPGDWEIRVDAGPGHRDYLELPEARTPARPHSQAQLPRIQPLAWVPLLGLGLLGGAGVAVRRRR